ncbi:myb family transcription factor family protein [Salix suchowensis]|nr:myb family transcription factor family protein [Salix suchowensis]
MVSSPSYLKNLHPLQVFSKKPPSSTLSSMKIKTLIHTLIVSHVCRIIRALSRAKSVVIEILKENQHVHFFISPTKSSRKRQKDRKIYLGSFRLHYNWCSSHVLPVREPVLDGFSSSHFYYDSSWNSIIANEQYEDSTDSQLSGYLQWLDEKVDGEDSDQSTEKDINRLADLFIANCHEKFILEKQESYRRFQEMMARSL